MQIYLKKPIPQIKEGQLHGKHLTLCHTDTALSSPFFPPHFSTLVYSSFPRISEAHPQEELSGPIQVDSATNIGSYLIPLLRLLPRVLPSIQRAKASHAQLLDTPLRSDQQALRLIARIPLIQRRKKYCSCEEKSAFTQWLFSIYARSLKDQVRQSKYPRTQILDPRTQSTLFYHSSATFIPTQSNNRIEVTSQSYIASHRKLYRNPSKAIQLSSPSYIALLTHPYTGIQVPARVRYLIQQIHTKELSYICGIVNYKYLFTS